MDCAYATHTFAAAAMVCGAAAGADGTLEGAAPTVRERFASGLPSGEADRREARSSLLLEALAFASGFSIVRTQTPA